MFQLLVVKCPGDMLDQKHWIRVTNCMLEIALTGIILKELESKNANVLGLCNDVFVSRRSLHRDCGGDQKAHAGVRAEVLRHT